MERDAPSNKHMILLVADVLSPTSQPKGPSDGSGGASAASLGRIEVSDGWYSIVAELDEHLSQLLCNRKLFVGQKLRILGAQMSGDAASPLEDHSCCLKLSINGTRRAHWAAKLGVCRQAAFSVSLRSLRPRGGHAPALRLIVTRRYPMQYFENGRRIRRNQKAEDMAQHRHELKCQQRLEEVQLQETAKQQPTTNGQEPREWERDVWGERLKDLVRADPLYQRDVSPFLKLRCSELTPQGQLSGSHCVLTVWRPTERHGHILREGTALVACGLKPTHRRTDASGAVSFHVASDRRSVFSPLPSAVPPPPSSSLSSTAAVELCALGLSARCGLPDLPALRQAVERVPLSLGELTQAHASIRGEDVDLLGCVVFVAPVHTYTEQRQQEVRERKVFLCTPHWSQIKQLIVVTVVESEEAKHTSSPLRCPQPLLLLNVRYELFDRNYKLHAVRTTRSSVLSLSGRGHGTALATAHRALQTWSQSELGGRAVREAMAAAQLLASPTNSIGN